MVPRPARPLPVRRHPVLLQAVGRPHPQGRRAAARRAYLGPDARHHDHPQRHARRCPVKTVIPQEVLAAVTAWATSTARLGRAPVTPVLAGLLLNASADGTLTAAAYDYETSALATAAAEVGEPGRALISAGLLKEAAAMLP